MSDKKLVTFEAIHTETEADATKEENFHYRTFIDGYPADENEEGTVVATVTTTLHGDIVTDWHLNAYREIPQAKELVAEVLKEHAAEWKKYCKTQVAKSSRSTYFVTFKVYGYYTAKVKADSISDAMRAGTAAYQEASFGELSYIDSNIMTVEDDDLNEVWNAKK